MNVSIDQFGRISWESPRCKKGLILHERILKVWDIAKWRDSHERVFFGLVDKDFKCESKENIFIIEQFCK